MVVYYLLLIRWWSLRTLKTDVIFKSRWIEFRRATLISKNGYEIEWDYVSRGDIKVVTVICKLKGFFADKYYADKYLFITQYRPSVNKLVFEFPAGLIDDSESVEQAALRELKEETGYVGIVKKVHPFVVKSAGLSDECTAIVEVEIDNINDIGKTKLEEAEDIYPVWLTIDQLKSYMNDLTGIVSADVYYYFMRE